MTSTLARWAHTLRRALRGGRQRTTAPTHREPEPTSASSYVPPAERPAEWAKDAAGLHAAGRALREIAAMLCVSEDTVARLVRDGQVHLAVERLGELLGPDAADAWLDAQVTRRVDDDLLDPDTALVSIAFAVLADDALVLAAPGQTWTLRPDCATRALPKSVIITGRQAEPPRVTVRYTDGRQEDDVDPSLITRYYWLAAWDHQDQEASR